MKRPQAAMPHTAIGDNIHLRFLIAPLFAALINQSARYSTRATVRVSALFDEFALIAAGFAVEITV